MYRFTSTATGELNLFDADAERILGVIGKRPGPRGVITAEEMPGALAALRAAVQAEREAPAAEPTDDGEADEEEEQEDRPEPISLGRRAHPFITMLERAHAEGADVLWGL